MCETCERDKDMKTETFKKKQKRHSRRVYIAHERPPREDIKKKGKPDVRTCLKRKDVHVAPNWEKLATVLGYKKKQVPDKSKQNKSDSHNIAMASGNIKAFQSNSKTESQTSDIWFDDVPKELLGIPCKHGVQQNGASTSDCDKDFGSSTWLTNVVAMDCEMVGTGTEGIDSIIARVSIVNVSGECLYDKYVTPKEDVTDYRTNVSGIRPSDLQNAEDLAVVQKEVDNILTGKILVGHALKNDLAVLFLSHPRSRIRDTSKYKPFRQMCDGRTPSLKKLALILLGVNIQEGEHSSVEDAHAAMQIYLMHSKEWEKSIKIKMKKKQKKHPQKLTSET